MKRFRKAAIVTVMAFVMFMQVFSVFGITADDIIINDDTYVPYSESLAKLPWETHYNSYIDKAFTQEKSDLLGDGSSNHIVFNGNNATFFGYYTESILDYLYYEANDPEPGEEVEDTFKFTIRPELSGSKSMFHSLHSFGFLINCTKNSDGTISGYFFALEENQVAVRKLDKANMESLHKSTSSSSKSGQIFANYPLVWADTRFPMAVGTDNAFVLKSTYTGFTITRNDEAIAAFDISTMDSENVPADYVGGNDFGLYAAYAGSESGHSGCSQLSYAIMNNIGLYTKETAPKTSVSVDILDFASTSTDKVVKTFVLEGYVGQKYTIIPLAKIDKFTYIGDIEKIEGVYGEELVFETLKYANLTYYINYVDTDGKVIKTTYVDGLDLDTQYTIVAEEIEGYELITTTSTNSGSLAKSSLTVSGSSKTIALTKDEPVKTVNFVYKKVAVETDAPKMGDTNLTLLWMGMAIVSLILIVVMVGVKRIGKKAAK